MKHIVFAPLKEEFETIRLRSSEINSFLNPSPFAFTSFDSEIECFWYGDILHTIYQHTMLWWYDKWMIVANDYMNIIKNNWPYIREKEYRWIENAIPSIVMEASKYTCDTIEQKLSVIIDYSWYQVWFSWTSDAQSDYTIIDIKSSSGKWTQDKADEQRQKYYYAWLYNVARWTERNVKFAYHVVTKQKTPQFQIFEYDIEFSKADEYVRNDLKLYLTNYHTNKQK